MNFITQNGQKDVVINAASFKDASKLRKAVMKSIVESNFTSGLDKGAFENVELSTLLDTGLKLILNTDMSNLFEQSVFECLKICTYDGKKSLNNYLMICLRQGKIITKSYQNVVRKTYALFSRASFQSFKPV